MPFDTILDAFHYVSDALPGERRAVVHRRTGQVFLASLKAGYDERPVGAESDPDYVSLPHRRELDPGKQSVLEFVQSHCPAERARAEGFFARPGAYRNVRELLRRRQLLESWQVFEEQQIESLLREWCAARDLPL